MLDWIITKSCICLQRSSNWNLCNKQPWSMPLCGRRLQGQHHCGGEQRAAGQNTWGKHCAFTEVLIVPDHYMFAYVAYICVVTLMSVWVDVCQLVCLNLLLLYRSEIISLTWRPLCNTKESSAKSTPMSMRWLPYICTYACTHTLQQVFDLWGDTLIQQLLEMASHIAAILPVERKLYILLCSSVCPPLWSPIHCCFVDWWIWKWSTFFSQWEDFLKKGNKTGTDEVNEKIKSQKPDQRALLIYTVS